MPGEQKHRTVEHESDEIDTEIPVVEPDVKAEETDEVLTDLDRALDENTIVIDDELRLLLDGITPVLEENATEFVESYQQRGGE